MKKVISVLTIMVLLLTCSVSCNSDVDEKMFGKKPVVVDHQHYYKLISDGSWQCTIDPCTYVLEGTESPYITVVVDGQPTEIIPLTGNIEKAVGAGNIVVNGSVITYTNNSGTAQNVVIRTNDIETTLHINDTSTGSIRHYGEAGLLEIIQCNTNSYHENGSIAFADIQKGRIVLEKTADVRQINIKKTGDSFDTVIIADGGIAEDKMPEIITRDSVVVPDSMTEGMHVATVQKLDNSGNVVGTPEKVKAYPNGSENAGSTQKVVEKSKNVEVVSTLGVKILDNGVSADKALDENKKVATIDAVTVDFGNEIFEDVEDPNKGDYVARIGTKGYLTLEDAAEAAKGVSVTVVLLKDIDFSEKYKTQFAYDFIFENDIVNLNGYSISNRNATIAFDGDNMTIKNGKFIGTNGASYGLFVGDGIYNDRISTGIVLEDLEFVGGVNVFAAEVTIREMLATTTANATSYYAIWADEAGYITVESGTFQSLSTIGGTVIHAYDGSGTHPGEPGSVTIKGGTYTALGDTVKMCGEGVEFIKICGGTFNRNPSTNVVEGYKAVDNGNGTWTVVKK